MILFRSKEERDSTTSLCIIFQAERGLEGLRHESRILHSVLGDADHNDCVIRGRQQSAKECSSGYSTLYDCGYEPVPPA